jgi:ABC-type phosphate/phosphonate transport system ATPase subunit
MQDIYLAEEEIVRIRARYNVVSKEALYEAIMDGRVASHPAWEDYIVWKNKEAHITQLRDLTEPS